MTNRVVTAENVFVDAGSGKIVLVIEGLDAALIQHKMEFSISPEKAREIGTVLIFQAGKATEREKWNKGGRP
jgi:hypothetical protein